MTIEALDVTIGELVEKYENNSQSGVVGYGGRLDIRPPYQREYVYGKKQEEEVIHSLLKEFPLNVMYWFERKDGKYEIIDGQQRTISIARYIAGKFSIKDENGRERYFKTWDEETRKRVKKYKLMVYLCRGTAKERLQWFEIINIAGVRLTPQEIRNAVYSCPWVTDARRYFGRAKSGGYKIGKDYIKGRVERQEHLQTILKWVSCGKIEEYMAEHVDHENAKELWTYFNNVIDWVKETFPKKRPEIMRGVEWGWLYEKYRNVPVDPEKLEQKIVSLLGDTELTDHQGVYEYVFSKNPSCLNIRSFSDDVKKHVFEKQKRRCAYCDEEFPFEKIEADHITPWSAGGKTVLENCQILCKPCNQKKSNK